MDERLSQLEGANGDGDSPHSTKQVGEHEGTLGPRQTFGTEQW